MHIDRKEVDTYIKQQIIPLFRKIGFKGSFPHLRRISSSSIDLITFQFDRNGGGFVLELAKTKNEVFTTHWGKEIKQSKLTAHDLNERLRIHPKGILENSSPNDWFRYDKPLFLKDPLKQILKDMKRNIPTIEEYFVSKR